MTYKDLAYICSQDDTLRCTNCKYYEQCNCFEQEFDGARPYEADTLSKQEAERLDLCICGQEANCIINGEGFCENCAKSYMVELFTAKNLQQMAEMLKLYFYKEN